MTDQPAPTCILCGGRVVIAPMPRRGESRTHLIECEDCGKRYQARAVWDANGVCTLAFINGSSGDRIAAVKEDT